MSRDPQNAMRAIDRGRAARMVATAITGDVEMFATAVQQIIDDDFGFMGFGSTVNVLRELSEELAGILVDVHGQDRAAGLVRLLVAQHAAEAEQEESGDTPDE